MKQPTTYNLQPTTKKGFTFIEILVVATIIGLLTTIAAVTYQSANKKARDGKRKADLEQVRSALEMYRSDSATGVYPSGNFGQMITTLQSSNYLTETPSDPKGYSYFYSSGAGGKTYDLCAYLELGSGSCGGNSCGSVTCNYRVQNP